MYLLVKLKFRRAFAIDIGGFPAGESLMGCIHSDTLFGGIANQWTRIPTPCDIMELIDKLNSEFPPFRISSAFPFFGTKYFLPTPRGTSGMYFEILKDIPYLELSNFLKLAGGTTSHIYKLKQENEDLAFMVPFGSPRVTIDRQTNSTSVYEQSGWTFTEGGGLYFLLELRDEGIRKALELCIALLGESGIGSDRSVGWGHFEVEINPVAADSEWSELFIERTSGTISYCTLSLCCPANTSEAEIAVSYDIISRSGWILSSSSFVQAKRRECKMFVEGSLFQHPVSGRLADVTPSSFKSEHDVYRYGLGMMVAGAWQGESR